MRKCRITAMRKAAYTDLMALYENPMEDACLIREGQVFWTDGSEKPEGLCDSAWETMLPFLQALLAGKEAIYEGWMKDPHTALVSCNDGFRPVSFYLEVVEED